MMKALVLVAVMFMGTHAFAKAPVLQSPWNFSAPVKMPRYQQWKKLSPEAQAKFIENVQAFLLRADAMARSGDKAKSSREAQIIQRLFDLWIETAEAKTKAKSKSKTQAQQPYCINQGVVKPLSDCDTKLGYKMHDFDTNEVLSKLGDAAQCPAGEKPCSPFFGFTSEGQMFCSSLNLTRDCAQKSAQPGTITLANTLAACEKGSPGAAKVKCDELKAFFDQQMDAVEKLCKDAPKRFACGILKEQINFVSSEKSEKDSAISAVGAEKAAEIPAQVNKLVQMIDKPAPCPPEAVVQPAPEPKAVAQTDDKTKCVSEQYELGEQPPVFGALYSKVLRGLQKGFICSEIDMPDKSRLTGDREKHVLFAQETPTSPPVLIDGLDVAVLDAASAFLVQEPFKVSKKDLIPYYFPKQVIVYPEKISDLPTRGWISTNGSRFRYAVDDRNSRVLLGIQPTGVAKELLVSVSPDGAKVLEDQPAKAQDPAKPSEDSTAPAAASQPE